MRMQVEKWGHSLALRIPKPFAEDADVREGTVVDFSVSEGRLVVAAAPRRKATLKELLAKVNRRNLHGEVDLGPPAGRESW